jgi:hypothetical protein
MAAIHFVRDGRGEGHAARKKEISINDATEKLLQCRAHFSKEGPVINPTAPFSATNPYRHVVLEVQPGEENDKFSVPGFYLIANLSPAESAKMFDIYF